MSFLKKLKGFVAPALTAVGTAFGGPIGGMIGGAIGGALSSPDNPGGNKLNQPTQPVSISSPFGNITATAGGVSGSGFDTSLSNPFRKLGVDSLAQASAVAPVTSVPGVGFDPLATLGVGGNEQLGSNAASRAYTGAGTKALDALGNFDPNAFAQTQYDRLANLAMPGEQRAAADLADRLFSRGRLGRNDTTAGRAFGDLSLSQSQAADSRALTALNLAGTEQTRLGNQAQQFGQLGGDLANTNATTTLNTFGKVQDANVANAEFTNKARAGLIDTATAAQTNATAAQNQFVDLAKLATGQQNNVAGQLVAAQPGNTAVAKADANAIGDVAAPVIGQLAGLLPPLGKKPAQPLPGPLGPVAAVQSDPLGLNGYGG